MQRVAFLCIATVFVVCGLDLGCCLNAAEPADNSACLVCHGNYKAEDLASRHARAGVACAQCHGASTEHCGNEENVIPPQIMYPKDKINPACRKCHATHKTAIAGSASKVCTDCHGKHRLSFRTKQWDKTSGKLLVSK